MDKRIYELSILIIDDLEDNILLTEGILDNEGFDNIHSVLNAKDGIEYLKENKVDLIILDIMMPEMDGITACRYIREELCLRDTMIILATAKNDIETLRIGLEEAGATDYVRKPFVNDLELISRIKNLLLLKLQLDISKQKEIEQKENERMLMSQSKLAAMGEMIGNIAHQWRQPLSVISTAASGLQMQKEFNLLNDDDFSKYTSTILKNTEYLSTIIEDFRDFYKPTQDKETFNMKDIMKINLELLSASLKYNQIEIIEDLENINIHSYKNELIQVVSSLITNASDAIVSQNIEGKRYIFIKCHSSDDKISITVTDNAKGVKETIKCKIFEPYFTTKHQSQGTGLGLYMSKKIVNESLNGLFYVENVEYNYNGNLENGARFTITIPLT